MNSSGTLRWTFLCAAAVIGCQSMQPTVFPIESAASVDGRPLEQRPRVINGSCQAPSVPTMSAAGDSASATVAFVLDSVGVIEPGSITVQAASVPELGDAAKASVATCRYEPGMIGGRGVRTRVIERVHFRTP